MSLDLETRLREFLASAPQRRYIVKVVSISHSAMTKTYHLWKESITGSVTDEDGVVLAVESSPIDVKLAGTPAHLDQAYTVTLSMADAADTMRRELDRIPLDTSERIAVVYREYLSDDLTEPQAVARLEVESIAHNRGAAVISAVAPRLNLNRTGELYTFSRFPSLRALA